MMKKKLAVLLVVLLMTALALPNMASAATTQVSTETALRDAIENAVEGDTIQLSGNITNTIGAFIYTNSYNRNITLDLNGYTLTGGYPFTIFQFNGSGSLTVKDSSVAQTGKITSPLPQGIFAFQGSFGFTLESGTLECTSTTEGNFSVLYSSSTGPIVINGGVMTYAGPGESSGNGAVITSQYNGGPVTINGGSLSTTWQNSQAVGVSIIRSTGTAAINVTGGSLTAANGTAINCTNTGGSLSISGGVVENKGAYEAVGSKCPFTVTGGTIIGNTAGAIASTGEVNISQAAGKTTLITSKVSASSENGTVRCSGGTLTVTSGTIQNTASPEGFSIYNHTIMGGATFVLTPSTPTIGSIGPAATKPSPNPATMEKTTASAASIDFWMYGTYTGGSFKVYDSSTATTVSTLATAALSGSTLTISSVGGGSLQAGDYYISFFKPIDTVYSYAESARTKFTVNPGPNDITKAGDTSFETRVNGTNVAAASLNSSVAIVPADGYSVATVTVAKTGDPSTTVTVTNNTFTMPAYPVTVTVALGLTDPYFTTQPAAANLNYGYAANSASLSVAAGHIVDGSTFAYQWYSNTTNSNTGGTAITGATSATYDIPGGKDAGTTYYYCVVTATNGSLTSSKASTAAAVTIAKADQSTTPAAPTVDANVATTSTAVTLNAITTTGHGSVQYAYSTTNTAPAADSSVWQTSTTITGLTKNTTYYFFARYEGDTNYNPSAASSGTSVTTLNGYTVTYNLNGATGTAPASSTMDVGTSFTAAQLGSMVKTGYTLLGWNTSSSATTATYLPGAVVSTISTDTQLYAIWKANTYSVKFNANGASGTMADQSFTYGATATGLTLNAFTWQGSYFAGWSTSANGNITYTDGQLVQNLSSTVNGVVNIYAVWSSQPVYQISGTVTRNSAPVSGATVEIVRGNTVVATATTDASGNYTFAGIPAGAYNIVASKTESGVTQKETILLEVTTSSQSNVNIALPVGNLSSVLDIAAGAPAAVVGNLDAVATENASAVPTDNVVVTMAINVRAASALNTSVVSAFTTVAQGQTLSYLDISISKVVNGGTPTAIHSTTALTKIIIPYDTANKTGLALYRWHDANNNGTVDAGETVAMTKNPSAGQEGYTVGNGTITVYSNSFSIYAIGYSTAGAAAGTSPKTGDSSTGANALFFALSIVCVCTTAVFRKKRSK